MSVYIWYIWFMSYFWTPMVNSKRFTPLTRAFLVHWTSVSGCLRSAVGASRFVFVKTTPLPQRSETFVARWTPSSRWCKWEARRWLEGLDEEQSIRQPRWLYVGRFLLKNAGYQVLMPQISNLVLQWQYWLTRGWSMTPYLSMYSRLHWCKMEMLRNTHAIGNIRHAKDM